MPPQVDLRPGSTGQAVKQLQDWLVSQGYMTQAQVNTGYGTYGPQTTAAVQKLQQALGVDNSSGPGYWGPRTIQAVSSMGGVSSNTNTQGGTQTQTSPGTSSNSPFSSSSLPSSSTGYYQYQGRYYQPNPDGTIPANQVQSWGFGLAQLPQDIASKVAMGQLTFPTLPEAPAQMAAPTGTDTSTGTADVNSALLALGLTQDQINKLDPTQKALLGVIGDSAKTLYGTQSGITLQQAINFAKSDPNLIAKYGDALKVDTQNLNDTLGQIQQSAALTTDQQRQQFEQERLQLAEQAAQAGQAYSGFRGKAQEQLSNNEQAIVESTRAQLQKSLNDAYRTFEAKYGTSATPTGSINFNDPSMQAGIDITGRTIGSIPGFQGSIAPSTVGNITGSNPIQQKADILSEAQTAYQLGQTPTI